MSVKKAIFRRHLFFSLRVVIVFCVLVSMSERGWAAASEEEMEELYQTAALWEVGTNRERVREAREKLIGLGADAVNFIVEKHLAYTESLEMRAVEEVFKALKEIAGPRLVEVLKNETEETYRLRNTFYLCGAIVWDGCGPALMDWLSRGSRLSGRALRALIGALGALKMEAAVSSLSPFLDHPDDMVVVTTANTLKAIGDSAAVPMLFQRMESGNLVRRMAGEDALAGFGAVALKEALAQLKEGERDSRFLAHCLSVIARANIKGNYDRVRKYLNHPEAMVRGYAVRAAVATAGERAFRDLRRLRKSETAPFVLYEIDQALSGEMVGAGSG
jgi:HEAT repeat protein